MSTRATHVLNRALLVAILGAIAWFVLTTPTRSPPGEQATAPAQAPPAQVAQVPTPGPVAPPAGRTPVLAAAAGRVEKLYFSQGGGGISAYVRSPDGRWIYYYAHLDRYAPGLAEGQQVQRGTALGFVGSTGNASPEAPHLHFAINAMEPGEHWWEGRAVNPYPLLTGRGGSH